MLCISAGYAVVLWLAICLSDTFVYCMETAKHILKRFPPSCSHTILVFPCEIVWRNSGRGRRVEVAYEKNAAISCFISDRIQDRVIVTMEY